MLILCCPFGSAATPVTLVTEHLKPFQVVSGDNINGLATNMIRGIMKAADVDYEIEAYPWHITYAKALKESNTCIYSISRTPERESKFHWIGKITELPTALYASRNSSIVINSLDDARHYKIAVLKNDVSHEFLQRHHFVEGRDYYVSENYESLLQLLDTPSRKIDLVIINQLLIENRFEDQNKSSQYKAVLPLQELTLDLYLACNKSTDPNVVKKLRNAMSAIDAESQMASVFANEFNAFN